MVCQEGDGGEVLELSVSGCCAAEDSPQPEASEQLRSQQEEDCGGCEDSALAVSLRHDEGLSLLNVSLDHVATEDATWSRVACGRPLSVPAPSLAPLGELPALRTINLRC